MTTILVVDDEWTLVETLIEMFEEKGFRVVSAANGKDGLDRAVEEKPDLVLTDFMMPIADGRELVLALRALPEFATMPIVMMSATLRAVALADGANGSLPVSAFIEKPMSWKALFSVISGLLNAPRSRE